jgi:hypothetical protein
MRIRIPFQKSLAMTYFGHLRERKFQLKGKPLTQPPLVKVLDTFFADYSNGVLCDE